MKVWLTLEKTRLGDRVMLWFDKPQKVYDKFIERERWTLGEGASFYYPLLTLEDVNYLVTEENSPLEIDIPFMRRFVADADEHTHWISVKDRKPKLKHSEDNLKYSDTVIVTNGKYRTSARWVHNTWAGWYGWYDDGDEELKDVTQWMPMPEPPKEGIQEEKD